MSNSSHPFFEHESAPDEFAGAGRNRRFDEAIDDEDFSYIQVICKVGGKEVPLAKRSRALYFGDRDLYRQEAGRFAQAERVRILSSDQFPRNLTLFDELKRSCQRGLVIPFVGAGMSKSAGCPDWKEYLLKLCREARLDHEVVRTRLEEEGDYEGVMNDLFEALGERRFNLNFARDFKTPDEVTGAITLLPGIFGNCAVTTNFDRVLETAYENASMPFAEKLTGRGGASSFFRAIPAGDRYLLKIHGNVNNAAGRVLRRKEYDEAYGSEGGIDLNLPLPKLLKRLFTSYSLLFLGCSLSADRTIRTFIRAAQEEDQDNLPHHYALLPCPADQEKEDIFTQRLADAHISPLWYPDGYHDHVEQILELLLD